MTLKEALTKAVQFGYTNLSTSDLYAIHNVLADNIDSLQSEIGYKQQLVMIVADEIQRRMDKAWKTI